MSSWTHNEDAILHTFWQRRTHAQMAALLPGRTERGVRNRCWRLRLVANPAWTPEDVLALRDAYEASRGTPVNIRDLARRLGRNVTGVSWKAGKLGLTSYHRTRSDEARRKIGANAKAAIQRNGHPRGMAGKQHSAKTRALIGDIHRGKPSNRTEEQRQAASDRMKAQRAATPTANAYSRTKSGKRPDLGIYLRSSWEANYARFLEWRKQRGDLYDWKYEARRFDFPIKRGTRSYCPDFQVWYSEKGPPEYHEVKGWMDATSRTRLARFRKYYPDEKLIVIAQKEYKSIRDQLSTVIPGWE